MKNLLTFYVFIVILFLGCESTDHDVKKSKLKEDISLAERHEMLRTAMFAIAEFANKPTVRRELLGYATEIHDYELVAPFKQLFATSKNGKVHGAFASSFREIIGSSTARSSNSDLESFLVDNDLILYAPYLAEQFSDSDLPITVTWHDGVDTTGVTEGIVYDPNGRTGMISVDDDYAFNNPTYVIMFDDGAVDLCEQQPENCDNDNNGGSSSIPYTPRDIDCRDLNDDDVLEVRMPEVRLISNTRSWPYRNKLHLFIITGDFTVNNGIINVTPDVNELWDEKEISRYRAGNKKWLSSGISFLLSNWIKKKSEMRIALAYKKLWSR